MATLGTDTHSFKDGLAQRIRDHLADKVVVPFKTRLPNEDIYRFGNGDPTFTISINDHKGLMALARFDQLRFSEAYINGSIDIEGDMWGVVSCRGVLRDRHPLHTFWRRLAPLFEGQLRINKTAITDHYEHENEFFLSFLDPTRCYSQALFERDNEPLETAQRRKLEYVVKSCELKPGDRVLDVGGGWGAFVEHAGKQGIHVTALTLARKSEQYLKDLVQRLQLPYEVIYGDFYQYASPQLYDAIVILGVMEHLPDYGAVVSQFQRLLKPGGKIYLDASSFREKYSKPTFISRYVFPGNHHYFVLHEFLSRVAKTNLEVQRVYNDRRSSYLTCREWAKNLESACQEITKLWSAKQCPTKQCSTKRWSKKQGEKLYRIFRLYLWGSSYAFYSRSMNAFRVVLERPEDGGA